LKNLEIDTNKIELSSQLVLPLWEENFIDIIDLSGPNPERIRTELQAVLHEKYENYVKIYTDGSKVGDKLDNAVVTP
jgi:hypothetical protein